MNPGNEQSPKQDDVLDYAQPDPPGIRARKAIYTGLIAAAVILVLFEGIPYLGVPGPRAKKVKCAANLRSIGQGIQLYCNDNRGQYPTRLDLLIAHADLDEKCFICEDSNDTPASGATQQLMIADFNKPGHLSYVYLGAGWNEKTVTPAMVVAHEKSATWHSGGGMNVLFGYGHVQWLDAKESAHLLTELAAGFNPPRPATSRAVTLPR